LLDKDNPVIFDVGANTGNYTNLVLQHFPNTQIHAFEPQPDNYSYLSNRKKNGNVKYYNIALGNSEKLQIL
jgi:FkbM family methyltransferase